MYYIICNLFYTLTYIICMLGNKFYAFYFIHLVYIFKTIFDSIYLIQAERGEGGALLTNFTDSFVCA